jgi:cation diffusion facilitator family transporter
LVIFLDSDKIIELGSTMITLISTFIQKKYAHLSYGQRRTKIIQSSNILGFFNNLFIFSVKLFIGLSINSIAILSDAINNLSDLISTGIAYISMYYASKPADDEHPEGHGRFEYIGSLFLAFIIFAIGFQVFMQSLERYSIQQSPQLNLVMVMILVFTALIKLWMFSYNRFVARQYKSEVNHSLAMDSLTDVMISSLILLSFGISASVKLPVDAFIGSLMSIFIMYTSFNIARKMVSRLLGSSPDPSLVQKIEGILNQSDWIQQIHELKIHDYGPNQLTGSVHVEVFDHLDLVFAHQVIDELERSIYEHTQVVMTIHLDPISTDLQQIAHIYDNVQVCLYHITSSVELKNLRYSLAKDHYIVIFDLKISSVQTQKAIENIKEKLIAHIEAKHPNYEVVINQVY